MSLAKEFDKAKKASPQAKVSLHDMFHVLNALKEQDDLGQVARTPIDLPPANSLRVLPEWGPQDGTEILPTTREPQPFRDSDNFQSAPVNGQTWDRFLDHLVDREGYRNVVYRDSLGKPTVGVGHLVRPEDNLQVGDRISDEQVRTFLERDARAAYTAAIEQANELGINDSEFVIALGSVNFQLGTGWRQTFPETWAHLENGNYEQAIRNIERSRWAQQTPTRTEDFTSAIRSATASDAFRPAAPALA